MKIAICGSMTFSPEMLSVAKQLKQLGHEPSLPEFTEHYSTLESRDDMHVEAAENKIKHDLIKHYYRIINENDAILVYNQTKKGIENYVGGNTLIEMAFAHVLDKKVYMYFPIPDMSYTDEIKAIKPVVLDRDLTKIL